MARRAIAPPKDVSGGQKSGAERDSAVSSADVVNWIRERIRRGRMVPGQRLIEADLVRETNATRSRVREALQRLESEGLLLIEEFRGASVRRFTRDELGAIYSTRAVLEALAARELAYAPAGDAKAELEAAQRELDAAVAASDHERFARSNDRWHAAIIEGGGNPYVAQFVDRLRIPVSRLLFSSFYSRQRIDGANADHQVITRAIIDGRGDDAEYAMRQHVLNGFKALVAQGLED